MNTGGPGRLLGCRHTVRVCGRTEYELAGLSAGAHTAGS